jgi:glycosyltransferase involved in cell wall biosynthesis
MVKKLKILVSCYACSPYRGSEPGMGWNFVEHLAKFHELHVITEKEKWESDIEKELDLRPELKENLKFYFIKKERNRWLRKIWPPSYYWYYKKWQKKTFNFAKKLHLKEKFDFVHQLNMVGFREPGYLWKLDIPFVWGPIGGMENTPYRMLPSMGLYGLWYYGMRNVINLYHMNFLTRSQKAAHRKTSVLIAATPHNSKKIKQFWKKDSIVIPEVGTITKDFNSLNITNRLEEDPIKIIWSGQHTPGKALNLLLIGLSLLKKDVKYKLDVLGKGSQYNKWENLGKKKKLNNNITWHGWLERKESFDVMKSGHVLVITSLKDLTSTVTLEALSLGLPIICLDHCGFSYVVNETCGIKIPLESPQQVIKDLAKAIEFLYDNENIRMKYAEGALNRAKDFSWEEKVIQLNEIYRKLITEKTDLKK